MNENYEKLTIWSEVGILWKYRTKQKRGHRRIGWVESFHEENKNKAASLTLLKSFGAKFQTTFVVCFLILTNYRLERRSYVTLKDRISNSVDPDETAQ